ncbi:MAG: YbjP/YqhG family protein [Tannerellaceae bacterium]|jgi:hypothetical protein|nr:YbjP/YqhG family protein [Tannerellaceae bacterium]
MKKRNLNYVLLALAIVILSCGQKAKSKTSVTQVDNREERAIQTLKEFYAAYISECDNLNGNLETMASIRNKYLTKTLRNKLEEQELDYDPIIQAQDCDKQTITTLEINPEPGRNVYNVCYTFPYDNQKICIKLFLMEEKGSYLIDDIISDVNIHGNK